MATDPEVTSSHFETSTTMTFIIITNVRFMLDVFFAICKLLINSEIRKKSAAIMKICSVTVEVLI